MKADLKAKWVEALRSGEYKQTQGRLRDSDSFCCLGVLCDLVQPKGWKRLGGSESGYWQHGDAYAVLPLNIERSTKLTVEEGGMLALLNDSGKSFREIAKVIQKKIPVTP